MAILDELLDLQGSYCGSAIKTGGPLRNYLKRQMN